MIITFRFKNFHSFHQEVVVNMQAGAYKELPEHLVPGVSGNLLKTLAIYGPNSSGKSQLIGALKFFLQYVRRQLSPIESGFPEKQFPLSTMQVSVVPPIEIPDSSNAPLSMSMQFLSGGHIFEYGFQLWKNELEEEFLTMDKKVVFQNNQGEFRLGRALQSRKKNQISFKIMGPCLGAVVNADLEGISHAMRAFSVFFREDFLQFDTFLLQRISPLPSVSGIHLQKIFAQKEARKFIVTHLNAMGLPTGETDLSPATCSTGMTKVIYLLYLFYCLSPRGGVLIADDFTAFLHPNISKYLIDLFQSPRNQQSQLIFTTHDTALLNRNQFRRDEAAIVSRDREGNSYLHTLADIRVRADASFSKDYLSGKYGILPIWENET